MSDPKAQTVSSNIPSTVEAKRFLALRTALLALCLLSLPLMIVGALVKANTSRPRSVTEAGQTHDYSKFSHSSPPEHAQLTVQTNCASCHRRSDSSVEPKFPGHRDCIRCHLAQFTESNSSSSVNPICTICHTPSALNSPNAPPKNFPALMSFNAVFDHAQHLRGIEQARPPQSCAACHTPMSRGVAQTIPSRLNAHRTCYQCHSPGGQASQFSSCGSCHHPGSYMPTPAASRAYHISFSHANHGARERLTCTDCHNVGGRGLPQGRQVSSILPSQHFSSPRAQSCLTCHNGLRAFGDNQTRDCARCHKGPGFRMRG